MYGSDCSTQKRSCPSRSTVFVVLVLLGQASSYSPTRENASPALLARTFHSKSLFGRARQPLGAHNHFFGVLHNHLAIEIAQVLCMRQHSETPARGFCAHPTRNHCSGLLVSHKTLDIIARVSSKPFSARKIIVRASLLTALSFSLRNPFRNRSASMCALHNFKGTIRCHTRIYSMDNIHNHARLPCPCPQLQRGPKQVYGRVWVVSLANGAPPVVNLGYRCKGLGGRTEGNTSHVPGAPHRALTTSQGTAARRVQAKAIQPPPTQTKGQPGDPAGE